MNHRSRWMLLIASVAMVALLGACSAEDSGPSVSTGNSPQQEQVQEASTKGNSEEETKCPGGFNVILDRNLQNRLFTDGLYGLDSEETRTVVLDAGMHEPRILAVYHNASPLGEVEPVTEDEIVTKDGKCYTARGRRAYEEWSVLFKVAPIASDQVPEVGTNTGAEPGGASFTDPGVITGNRDGFKVTFVDATGNKVKEHFILRRCGNVVIPGLVIVPGIRVRPPHVPPTVVPVKPPGVPHEGPDTQPPQVNPKPWQTAPTVDYGGRGHLEEVVANQPTSNNNTQSSTQSGTNSGGGAGSSPSGSHGGGSQGTSDTDNNTTFVTQPPNSGTVPEP